MDRLDRTLEHLVDDGRMSVTLADEVSREFHTRHVDIRGRLAELAGYGGAGLAILGVVLIGSQVWTDLGQILRAGIPALACAGLLLGAWAVVHGIDLAAHPVRARLAQVMGFCSAIMGALTVLVAFPMPEGDVDRPWQPTVALGGRPADLFRGVAVGARLDQHVWGGRIPLRLRARGHAVVAHRPARSGTVRALHGGARRCGGFRFFRGTSRQPG